MQIVDLFSGIGGFSLAGHWLGWETIQFCEINPFGQKVLSYHFPGVPIHDDIKTLDYDNIRKRIDPNRPVIVVGGFPCQPYSAAGKRLGKDDDRHLWPYCLETVRQLRPRYCVFENVRGLTNWNGGVVFDEVQADLEAEGYEVLPFLLPACAVNAPHRRDRVWFVAHPNSDQRPKGRLYQAGPEEAERHLSAFRSRNDWGTWEDFPTQSPVCGRDDGLPTGLDGITFSKWRNESIKAYGNAIVPQVAFQIFKAIVMYESKLKHEWS